MRMHLLALALLAAPATALGEQPKTNPYTPPGELTRFQMGRTRSGTYLWFREYGNWRVWARPTGDGDWYRPPFTVQDSIPGVGIVKFGVEEPAMASRIR